jgi:hypothetical protein
MELYGRIKVESPHPGFRFIRSAVSNYAGYRPRLDESLIEIATADKFYENIAEGCLFYMTYEGLSGAPSETVSNQYMFVRAHEKVSGTVRARILKYDRWIATTVTPRHHLSGSPLNGFFLSEVSAKRYLTHCIDVYSQDKDWQSFVRAESKIHYGRQCNFHHTSSAID